MKKIIITGASGFIGRHCLLPFDLLGSTSVAQLVASIHPSHLLHFAWNATPGQFWASRDNLKWLKSSIDLLEAFADQGGKRAVFSGTCAEYDWSASPFEEKVTPCFPQTLYGSSKLGPDLLSLWAARIPSTLDSFSDPGARTKRTGFLLPRRPCSRFSSCPGCG
jgi:nucleoside-diphosphate-sugar epimerase